MKTQEEIDKIRADYKKQWDLDIRRMEAKRDYYQANVDAITAATATGVIHLSAQPNEFFAGFTLRQQIEELTENIAYRKLQWEIIQDEFETSDRVRASQI